MELLVRPALRPPRHRSAAGGTRSTSSISRPMSGPGRSTNARGSRWTG